MRLSLDADRSRPEALIQPQSIAFDVDGVIADTMSLFLAIAHDDFNIQGIRYEDIACYNLEDCLDMDRNVIARIVLRILEGDYSRPLQPIPGAPTVLQRLAREVPSLLFVTARPNVGPVGDWMRRMLDDAAAGIEIVATGSFEAKAEVLIRRNITHFVEDRLETCFALDAVGVVPVLFAQPWNRQAHPFMEVSTWQELDQLIRWETP
jgi:5'(3')-deoxyribonucleotidase